MRVLKKLKGVLTIIAICLLLVRVNHSPSPVTIIDNGKVLAQTQHDPIEITSDADFVSLGFSGSGTPSEPYIIEDLAIDSLTGFPCISVEGNISSNYVIRSCEFSGSTSRYYSVVANACLYLNAGSVTIESCSFTNCSIGIGIDEIDAVMIYDNSFQILAAGTGIYLGGSIGEVYENTITGPIMRPPYSAPSKGIDIMGSNYSIYDNEISYVDTGIYVYYSLNDIHNNTIHDCLIGASMAVPSSDNRFYYNYVYANQLNAHDDGTDNIWDDGVSAGNIWGDATEAPYPIDGIADSVDRYPIIIEHELDLFLPLTIFAAVVIGLTVLVFIIKRQES